MLSIKLLLYNFAIKSLYLENLILTILPTQQCQNDKLQKHNPVTTILFE